MPKLDKTQIEFIKRSTLIPGFYTGSTVMDLLEHIEHQQHESDRLIENVTQLQKENDRRESALHDIWKALGSHSRNNLADQVRGLTDELEAFRREHEAKKVVLPKEIAEAVEWYKKNWDIRLLFDIGWIRNRSEDETNPHAITIITFHDSSSDNQIKYFSALINGFTIEEPATTEDKIEARLEELLQKNGIDSVVPVRELAVLLTLGVREILAEDRQEVE